MAVKNADLVVSLFGEGKWKQVPGHQEIELALVKLAGLCEEIGGEYAVKADSYVELAQFFLDTRGDYEGRHGTNHNSAYDQDHLPVAEQTEAVGHAVRAQYMYTGMADVALKTGTTEYDAALHALWDDVTHKKSYVTGGVGAVAGNEGFGDAYFLPNDSAYCETCANIANMMWNQRMNLLYGDSKYADVMENVLYNNVISCVNFEGNRFFYGNPMSSTGGKDRSEWFGTACCPPNLMRTVESLGGYIYTQKQGEITTNLYIGNETDFNIGGNKMTLNMQTDMPWEGNVKLTVLTEKSQNFALKLRIPSWATGENKAVVNGKEIPVKADEKGYLVLDQNWSNGDVIELTFPMSVERTHTDERVENNIGFTAIKRGPIVYAAEEADNDFQINRAYLPKDAEFTKEWTDNLNGAEDPYGVRALQKLKAPGKVQTISGEEDVTWTLIPYYAWDNRGADAMTVYVKEEPWDNELALESFAVPSAVYTSKYDNVNNLNDGTDARWTAYGYPGENPWVQYDFEAPVTIWGCDIKWYDDNGGVQIPDGLTIQYWDEAASEFVSVEQNGEYNTFSKNAFNSYTFNPVVTTKIRLVIQNDIRKVAPGIMEWKLQGELGQLDLENVPLSGIKYGDRDYTTNYDIMNQATFAPVKTEKVRVLMNSNRPMGLMEAELYTEKGENVVLDASLTASYTCEEWSSLSVVNDGKWENKSQIAGDKTNTWSTYPETGEHWIEFTLKEPETISGAGMFWYRAHDDGVVKPQSWKIQYMENGEWKDVEHQPGQQVEGFDNNVFEYEVAIPKDSRIPYVSAQCKYPFVEIHVQQPDGIPGEATITVKGPKGDARFYTVNFVEEKEDIENPDPDNPNTPNPPGEDTDKGGQSVAGNSGNKKAAKTGDMQNILETVGMMLLAAAVIYGRKRMRG